MHTRNWIAAALLAAGAAQAASVIETREGEDEAPSLMFVQGHQARLESEPGQYVLVDTRAGQFLAVDEGSSRIIDMTTAGAAAEAPRTSPVRARLERRGAGPAIAGFATEHYQLLADDQLCADTWLSRDALEKAELGEFMRGFAAFYAEQHAAYQALGADPEPCEEAEALAMSRYPELGMPLRTLGAGGGLRQEVLSIRTGVPVERGFFEAPESYTRLSLEQFLRGAFMESGAD